MATFLLANEMIITMEQYITFFSNHPVLSSAWVAIVVLLIVGTVRGLVSNIKPISPQQLTFLVNREDGVVVDIRADKEFKAGKILDSIHLSMEQSNKNDFSALEKYKNKPIIVVCNAGISASGVAAKLSKAGFSRVSILKGGMNAWLSAGLPIVK
jgi:rhodanese-related sulfurtransferase